jgi:hypothetical protein
MKIRDAGAAPAHLAPGRRRSGATSGNGSSRHELVDVLEVAVDRREAHECDLVELPQPLHEELADLIGRHLPVGALVHHGLDPVHHALEALHRDGALLAGLEETGQDLLAIEALATPVLLDDEVRDLVDTLVGGEALAAGEALATPADDLALLALARVDDLVLEVGAERTLQDSTSWPGAELGSNVIGPRDAWAGRSERRSRPRPPARPRRPGRGSAPPVRGGRDPARVWEGW